MTTWMVVLFVAGYLAIALEHPLKLNKAASALLLGVAIWVCCVLDADRIVAEVPSWFANTHAGEPALLRTHYLVESKFVDLVGETAGLLFFLLGAMTIVELVDANDGFAIITDHVRTRKKWALLWIVAWLTFFLSSVLDNLTTTIVMVSLLRKIVSDKPTRHLFVGLVVIAANAGGAWTPIGDVTTTMLWMAGKYTPSEVMGGLAIPSVLCLLVPLLALTFTAGGEVEDAPPPSTSIEPAKRSTQLLFLALGLLALLSVPVFKALTHLPPFMGILLSLGVLWVVSELVNHNADEAMRSRTGVVAVLKRVDVSSLMFFLGILLAVGGLGTVGLLGRLANWLDQSLGSTTLVAVVIGLVSSVVDNVPLVAAGISMYDFPAGHPFWLELAYCAGTGGSCLIIGSAAGVAAMGLENIDFLWYLRKISPLALAGYLAGVAYCAMT